MPLANGIAVFGGTFDPVHFGHLRSAVEAREALGVETVRFIPSNIPPHREAPRATPAQRVAMLKLAIDDMPGFEIDERELARAGNSYTVDTLRSIRDEIGSAMPLTTVIGFDAFRSLDEWHEWRALLDYAHIAVMERPGYSDADLSASMQAFAKDKTVAEAACLSTRPSGMLCRLRLSQIGFSASAVREILAAGKSPAFMMPSEVVSYIYDNGLYGAVN